MSLQFLSPWFLLGLLGIALPILVHLLTRRQQKRIPFSAVYLLEQVQKRSIRRSQPNRLLLLLFRCLAIACLSLALASPIFSFGGPEEFLPSKPTANVIVIDNSYSMAARAKDQALYDQTVAFAASLLQRLPANNTFSLVYASDPARVVQDWTGDPAQIVKLLKLSKPSFQTTSIGQGLTKAYDLLSTAQEENRRIFVLTDLDRNGWKEKELENLTENPGSVPIKIIDFSAHRMEKNRALVEHVDLTQEFLTNNRILRVEARIANLQPDTAISQLRVALVVDGKTKSEDFIDLPPGGRVDKAFSFPYLGREAVQGYVEIQDDGLNVDNRRLFSFQPDRKIQVLVVDGDPRGVSHQNESFYVEKALNPFRATVTDIQPTISTLAELADRKLEQYSVVILCNVRSLPFDYERRLEEFVKRGGGLFVALGDQVDAKFYNEKMGILLPVTLQTLNQIDTESEPFRLEGGDHPHPVLRTFQGKSMHQMAQVPFHALYSVRPRADRDFLVPMRFTNEYPALIESAYGRGKVLLFTSSLDRDWNQFPIQPTFLPWLQRWVKYIAQSLESLSEQNLKVGQPIQLEDVSPYAYIVAPGGGITALEKIGDAELQFGDTWTPGPYRLLQSGTAPEGERHEGEPGTRVTLLPADARYIGTVTANIDTAESLSETLTPEDVKKLLPGYTVTVLRDTEMKETSRVDGGVPLVGPFLFLLACVFLVEGWMIRRE
ncbi:BatA domain-containing protein [Nitrospina gracilis]|uniref:BatA domain-containing protein n=1 Tax=Nitrospina gracilis TaxID=35801 RepID=UPI001F316107|nr:BatA domain-containing protein [Nitrospina gracilis]MCF8720049.1 5S rRNA maturation endonuclease (ribonuclease M5) [Nitrospina gracilis Nb-211]